MAEDPADIARGIISASLYMVLATAGETGRPWASPVYFANSGYAEFFWVSSPDAAHSRNIAVRPRQYPGHRVRRTARPGAGGRAATAWTCS
jgi:hypothetical protein